jgi:hypothetical protein
MRARLVKGGIVARLSETDEQLVGVGVLGGTMTWTTAEARRNRHAAQHTRYSILLHSLLLGTLVCSLGRLAQG